MLSLKSILQDHLSFSNCRTRSPIFSISSTSSFSHILYIIHLLTKKPCLLKPRSSVSPKDFHNQTEFQSRKRPTINANHSLQQSKNYAKSRKSTEKERKKSQRKHISSNHQSKQDCNTTQWLRTFGFESWWDMAGGGCGGAARRIAETSSLGLAWRFCGVVWWAEEGFKIERVERVGGGRALETGATESVTDFLSKKVLPIWPAK